MKASNYVRRHVGALPDAILDTLMQYHGCSLHNGPDSKACLADFLRTDLVMDEVVGPSQVPPGLPHLQPGPHVPRGGLDD